MGSSLGPVLANIIMTELEDKVIKPLITNGTIKFYTRFVDDTLLVIKPENVKKKYIMLSINLIRTHVLLLICLKIKYLIF